MDPGAARFVVDKKNMKIRYEMGWIQVSGALDRSNKIPYGSRRFLEGFGLGKQWKNIENHRTTIENHRKTIEHH